MASTVAHPMSESSLSSLDVLFSVGRDSLASRKGLMEEEAAPVNKYVDEEEAEAEEEEEDEATTKDQEPPDSRSSSGEALSSPSSLSPAEERANGSRLEGGCASGAGAGAAASGSGVGFGVGRVEEEEDDGEQEQKGKAALDQSGIGNGVAEKRRSPSPAGEARQEREAESSGRNETVNGAADGTAPSLPTDGVGGHGRKLSLEEVLRKYHDSGPDSVSSLSAATTSSPPKAHHRRRSSQEEFEKSEDMQWTNMIYRQDSLSQTERPLGDPVSRSRANSHSAIHSRSASNVSWAGGHRVKVYLLGLDGEWEDMGTGHLYYQYVESHTEGEEDWLALAVQAEDVNEPRVLLEHHVDADIDYELQESKMVLWQEQRGSDAELALSFQFEEGCRDIWERIQRVKANIFVYPHGYPVVIIPAHINSLPPIPEIALFDIEERPIEEEQAVREDKEDLAVLLAEVESRSAASSHDTDEREQVQSSKGDSEEDLREDGEHKQWGLLRRTSSTCSVASSQGPGTDQESSELNLAIMISKKSEGTQGTQGGLAEVHEEEGDEEERETECEREDNKEQRLVEDGRRGGGATDQSHDAASTALRLAVEDVVPTASTAQHVKQDDEQVASASQRTAGASAHAVVGKEAGPQMKADGEGTEGEEGGDLEIEETALQEPGNPDQWIYIDDYNQLQGPFPADTMRRWWEAGFFHEAIRAKVYLKDDPRAEDERTFAALGTLVAMDPLVFQVSRTPSGAVSEPAAHAGALRIAWHQDIVDDRGSKEAGNVDARKGRVRARSEGGKQHDSDVVARGKHRHAKSSGSGMTQSRSGRERSNTADARSTHRKSKSASVVDRERILSSRHRSTSSNSLSSSGSTGSSIPAVATDELSLPTFMRSTIAHRSRVQQMMQERELQETQRGVHDSKSNSSLQMLAELYKVGDSPPASRESSTVSSRSSRKRSKKPSHSSSNSSRNSSSSSGTPSYLRRTTASNNKQNAAEGNAAGDTAPSVHKWRPGLPSNNGPASGASAGTSSSSLPRSNSDRALSDYKKYGPLSPMQQQTRNEIMITPRLDDLDDGMDAGMDATLVEQRVGDGGDSEEVQSLNPRRQQSQSQEQKQPKQAKQGRSNAASSGATLGSRVRSTLRSLRSRLRSPRKNASSSDSGIEGASTSASRQKAAEERRRKQEQEQAEKRKRQQEKREREEQKQREKARAKDGSRRKSFSSFFSRTSRRAQPGKAEQQTEQLSKSAAGKPKYGWQPMPI